MTKSVEQSSLLWSSPAVASRIKEIAHPYIDVLNAKAATLRSSGKEVISLGQAIPGFSPPPVALDAARDALRNPETHIYSADAGILSLRVSLCHRLHASFGIEADPESEVIITTGGNQAFMLALLTLVEQGDEVLLPTPYYLNHEMAVRTVGAVPVEVPLEEDDGFTLTLEKIQPYLSERSKALVIVSPNNPTGTVYDESELKRIVSALSPRGMTIISDETYQHFLYDGKKHFSLGSQRAWRENVIVVGSLSKSFAITGWRIGYMLAHAMFIEQAMKVQDSMVICASVIGQEMAAAAVEHAWDYPITFNEQFNQRRLYLERRLKSIRGLHWTPTYGGFFAFVRVEGCKDSIALSEQILDRIHVVTTPGRIFGHVGGGFIRLSYGSVDLPKLEKACDRLEEYFSQD